MKLEFLGTGAADWKERYRDTEGYRRFSAMLVEDDLLIDSGPHIFDYEKDFGREGCYGKVENILLTHSHGDHLRVENLERLCAERERDFWCEEHAAEKVKHIGGLKLHILEPYRREAVGQYFVTALPANHGTTVLEEQALHYIIERDGCRILYACDGAWFLRNTWYHMRQLKFDLMILDGTIGDVCGDYRIFEHNSIRMVELMAETFRGTEILNPGARIFISHLARGLHGTQAETEERLRESGIEVACDGEVLEITPADADVSMEATENAAEICKAESENTESISVGEIEKAVKAE